MKLANIFFLISLVFGFCLSTRADINSMRARVPQVTQLKDAGLIGEQTDGFLGVVKPNPQAQAVVDAENADRREEYQKRSKAQGQAADTLAKVLGDARIRQEQAGRFIKSAGGQWQKK